MSKPDERRTRSNTVARLLGMLTIQLAKGFVAIAGVPVQETGDITDAVRQQIPGTWLPMTVKRGDESLELVARFPPRR